jgi:hypothetical protein
VSPPLQRRLGEGLVLPLLVLTGFSLYAGDLCAERGNQGRPPLPAGSEAPLVFDSEVVRLLVGPDSVEVEGTYRFSCSPAAPEFVTLFYPYPLDSLLGGAKGVSLECRTRGGAWLNAWYRDLPSGAGAAWRVPVSAGGDLEVRAVYRQALLAPYARYIVTTTRAWSSPLKQARFEIYLPSGARPVQFSYPFELETRGAGPCYVYEVRDFWPNEDIVVEWTP